MAYDGPFPHPVITGGTGRATLTAFDIIVGNGTGAVALVGPGSAGQVLQSGGNAANPAYSTATYPSTATATGTILRADGTNWVATTATYPATTTINQILYSSSNNVIGGITAANNGTLISGATGIPSFLANGTTGQILTATTGSPPSWQPNAAAGAVTTINGDSGSITGNTVTIYANNATQNSGASVEFVNSGSTSTLNVTDSDNNTFIGNLSGNGTLSGTVNTCLGKSTGAGLTTGSGNVIIGFEAGKTAATIGTNTLIGWKAGSAGTGGSNTCAVGGGTLNNVTGNENCAFGTNAGASITSGSTNILLGNNSGSNFSSSESNNIIIGNSGTAADANTIRIGVQGSSTGQQNKCFVAGITGVSVSNKNIVTLNTSTGQLGSDSTIAVAQGGTGVGTLTGLALGSGTSNFTGVTYVAATSYTPVLAFGGGSTGITYTTQSGRYTQIGNMVTFTVDITLSNKGSSTGNATVTLPVTAAAGVPTADICMMLLTVTTTGTYIVFDIAASATTGSIAQVIASTGAVSILTHTAFNNTTVIRIAGSYFV